MVCQQLGNILTDIQLSHKSRGENEKIINNFIINFNFKYYVCGARFK